LLAADQIQFSVYQGTSLDLPDEFERIAVLKEHEFTPADKAREISPA
jgi:hypothetical protein